MTIQDYIDDWEPDDEDDELDDEALWAPVLTITAGFQKDGRFRVPAVRDKKKMNVLEAVSRLSGTDLLSLCVPAGTVISENWISTAAFPSALYAGGESGKRGTAGDVWTAGLERALLDAYAAHFFTRFGQEKTGSVHYEQEYLLQGNASERENLKHTVNELLAVREAVNLAALYADSEKRSEAEALALAITGLAGITPITAAASFFIMTVWGVCRVGGRCEGSAGGRKNSFFQTAGGVADFAFCSDGKGRVHLSGNGDGSFIEKRDRRQRAGLPGLAETLFPDTGKEPFLLPDDGYDSEPHFRKKSRDFGWISASMG